MDRGILNIFSRKHFSAVIVLLQKFDVYGGLVVSVKQVLVHVAKFIMVVSF